jgi:hypothetical protein
MFISSLMKSGAEYVKRLLVNIDGYSDVEHKKLISGSAGKNAADDHSRKTRDSAVKENESQSQQAETSNSKESDNHVVDPNCSSDSEGQSLPAEEVKGAEDVRNTSIIDTTNKTLMEKPVETTPDVYLDVPSLNGKELKLNVEDLDAKGALNAELAGLIKINVGVTAGIKKLDLDIKM